jgi:ATP-dependent exoDNAse (exonuclease V) beta subunit
MAILVRSPGASVQSLSRALALNNIPVEIDASALSLYENPAVRPLITITRIVLGDLKLKQSNWSEIEELLRSEYGGADSLSLRAMRLSLAKLRSESDPKSSVEIALDILETGMAPIDSDSILPLQRIADLIKEGRKALKLKGDITDIFWAIWNSARNYEGRFLQDVWREVALNGGARGAAADRDLDAVIQLFESARRFTERTPHSKPKLFISQITSESILSDAITAKGVREEVVSILTVHAAKGREWEIVALSGLQEGVWPNYKQRGTLLGSERLVEHLRTGLTKRNEIEYASRSALIEDERRLINSAISRAKSQLIAVAHTEDESEPSAYFEEIFESIHGMSSYEIESVKAPRALSQQAVIAELRAKVESGDSTSAAVLNLLAQERISAADSQNWLGTKEISSVEPAIDPDKQVSVSPSNLQTFSECGMKWFIERSGGRDGDSSAQLIGSAIHGVAEKLLKVPNATLEDLQSDIIENWKLIDQNRGWIKGYELNNALEKIEKLFKWHQKYKFERELIAVEAKFEKEFGRALFNGSVDRVERDKDGRIYIVDIKSGKGSDVTGEDAKTNKQLSGYQLAVSEEAFFDENIRGEVLGSSLLYLGSDAKLGTEKKQPALDPAEIKAELITTAEAMAAKEFVATSNKRCRNCPVKKVCPIQSSGRTVLDGE